MEKETYYVNLNPISMDTISRVKVNDGQMIEYEITATEAEIKDFQKLLTAVQSHDVELGNLFTFRHFDDETIDKDRNEYQSGLDDIYEQLHKLGTEETKQKVNDIHLRNNSE